MSTLEAKPGLNLMIEYLDVCNAASEAHRHSVLYKPIIAAYDSFFVNRQVGIDIYGSDPDQIETTVTIRLVNRMFEVVPVVEAHPSFHLKLGRRYMEDVVAHRAEYIRHPEKLDWDWLKSRIGMKPHHEPARDVSSRASRNRHHEAPANAVESKGDDMTCEVCNRLERLFLESMIYADKAETALRCYLITHQWSASVSDMDEYNALRAEQERTADERHRAYTDLVIHGTSESG